jgi:hypothetical protein
LFAFLRDAPYKLGPIYFFLICTFMHIQIDIVSDFKHRYLCFVLLLGNITYICKLNEHLFNIDLQIHLMCFNGRREQRYFLKLKMNLMKRQ